MINIFLVAATLTSAGYYDNYRILEPTPFRDMKQCELIIRDITNYPQYTALMTDSDDRAGCVEIQPGDSIEKAFNRQ